MINKVLMSHANKEMLLEAASAADNTNGVILSPQMMAKRFVAVDNSVLALFAAIDRHRPQTVLWDLFVDDTNAVAVMRAARRKWGSQCPAFIILCKFSNMRLERELYEAGAAGIVTMPIDAAELYRLLCPEDRSENSWGMSGADSIEITITGKSLETLVTDIIHQIGVPAHIKGYHYLRFSIVEAVQEPTVLDAVTKELYPRVAERFLTTPSRVERAIRHAIEVAWARGDIQTLDYYFGSTVQISRGKPTNSEFIALIADKIRVGLRPAS